MQRRRHAKTREAMLDFFNRKCRICSFNDVRALEIDHVYGDGNIHSSGTARRNRTPLTVDKIIKAPHRFQLLCANCHRIKTVIEGDQTTRIEPVGQLNWIEANEGAGN